MALFADFLRAGTVLRNVVCGKQSAVPDAERSIPVSLEEALAGKTVRTVIDVGAHLGEYSRPLRKRFPAAAAFAFEPQASCRAVLESIEGLTVFPCALGDRNGTDRFRCNAFTPASSFLPMRGLSVRAFPQTFHTRYETVAVRRLDDVLPPESLEPHIFLKIDVQGYEDRVIAGGRGEIGRAAALLIEVSFEELYAGQRLFPAVRAELEALGLRFSGFTQEIRHRLTGRRLQADALFVRS